MEGVTRDFVIKWTKSPKQNFSKDKRGWKKGKTRKHTKIDEQRIQKIHQGLTENSEIYFAGASAIIQKWMETYPNIKPPHPKFIGRTLKKFGLSKKIQKGRNKGASHYLHYPAYSIEQLRNSLLEVDFIGKKFIRNRTEPVNFIAFSLRQPRKLKHFRRITAETAENVIQELRRFFRKFEKPEVVKMDNDLAFIGSGSGQRSLSKVILFLLQEKIIPVFTAPRKPWNQASIEGANSIFTRKFWKRWDFKNTREIDEKLEGFNKSYQWYLAYKSLKDQSPRKTKFIPKIYFIRKVYEDERTGKGCIEVLNEKISLPKSYINFFTLTEWNLKQEQLYVYFEKEQKLKLIKKRSFKINQRSKEKCRLSFVL